MSTTSTKSITKSINLTESEIELVCALAEQEFLSESAMLDKLFHEGLSK